METHVFAAALGIEAEFDGDRLKERAFADSVFADEESHGGMQFEAFEFFDGGDAEGKGFPIIHFLAVEPHCPDKPCSQSRHSLCSTMSATGYGASLLVIPLQADVCSVILTG